jgi:urease accessory protein UreF
MKKFTFLFIMMISSVWCFGQVNPINFEPAGQGANWTWTVFENGVNPVLEFINNPDKSGINTSDRVAKFTALAAGFPYAGCESMRGSDLGSFVLSSTNSVIKIKVWKPVISDVGIKLVSNLGWSQGEIKVKNTKINMWEELTFDFSSFMNPPASEGMLNQIVIFPDFAPRTQNNIVYFDDITFGSSTGGGATAPTVAAPTPNRPAASVKSLFSNAYTNLTVDTWRTSWSAATLEDLQIAGNDTKKYSTLDFVGVETVANQVDISAMTHVHLDIWTPNMTSFGLKLVDFGANGVFGGGDDVEHQVNIPNPALGQWVSLDIPISDFTGLTTKKNIAQYIMVGVPSGTSTLFIDNFYFYTGGAAPTAPTAAAPTPTRPAASVKSLFSNAYTNLTVDIWRTSWSAATLEDLQIAGNDTKKYSALDFVGIETVANQVDISAMTHVHLDMWTPNMTSFGMKLVDFGANGVFGGGDDVEHQVNIPNPALGQWVSLDIPLSDFVGLTTKKNIAQYILVGVPSGTSTLFIDNFYFYTGGAAPTAPIAAAPTPTRPAASVKSLFSNAYTNLTVDTWRTSWSAATLEDLQIAGNDTKKYSALDFVGIETVANQVDISAMTHVHLDMWTPNMTSFGMKLVDFGANGVFGGGDDVEHQVNIPNPALGQWVSLDIPLSDFVGLTTKKNIAQYILVGVPSGTSTLFIDNFYFYATTVAPTAPTAAAPTPTRPAASVKSLFSNAYTNLTVDTWRTSWSAATLDDIQIAGNDTKRYTALDFVGIETVANQVDISAMTHVHLDMWTPNMTSFGMKLVDFGANGVFGGGDDVEHQVNVPNPALGQWVSLDIPLSDFVGLTTKKNIAQYILVGVPSGTSTLFIDNFYFYTAPSSTIEPNSDHIKLYPNPVNKGSLVQLSEEFKSIELVNLLGQTVLTTFGSAFTVADVQSGLYIIKLKDSDGKIFTKKMIVE